MIFEMEEIRRSGRVCRMEIRDGAAAWFCCSLNARAPLGSRALGWNAEVPGGILDSNRSLAKEMSHPLIRRMTRVVKSATAGLMVDLLRPQFLK